MKPAVRLDAETIRRCIASPTEFSRVVLGLDLFGYQSELAEDPARWRLCCSGRQVGKTTLGAVLALHRMWSQPAANVLVASALEDAAKRLMGTMVGLARRAPMLAGSVSDDQKLSLTLTNGSACQAIPSSIRQAIGHTVALLLTDESGYLSNEFYEHLEPTIVAAPGSRVVCFSTPWGGPDAWFRRLFQRAEDEKAAGVRGGAYASFRWPSAVSPLMDQALLAEIEARGDTEAYRRMYLGEFTDESGAYFTESEIESATADYKLLPPERARALSSWDYERKCKERMFTGVGGIDYGFSVDKNVAVIVSALDDMGANSRVIHYVSWLEGHSRMEYEPFTDRLVDIARSYRIFVYASEVNGVGMAPTQSLRRKMREEGLGGYVQDIWTDHRRKQAGMSLLKSELQAGTLIIPRHPELMQELRCLDYQMTDSGSVRIAARNGQHDDYPMALMSALTATRAKPNPESTLGPMFPHVVTPRGTVMPVDPRPRKYWTSSFGSAQGRERGTEPGW